LLQGFAQQLNPLYDEIFQRFPTAYYRTCYQSQWTTDMVFREAGFLKRLMSIPTPHGMMDFSSADVLRYFGRRIQPQGEVPGNFNGQPQGNRKRRREGERVKFWMLAHLPVPMTCCRDPADPE
jgi:hypothetical protein